MVNAKGFLQSRLPRLLSMLETPGFLLMEESERRQLLEKAHSIEERLEKLGSTTLVIGIVGGTGVGKSTLMNALAGSEIAHTSYRRPDTDAVLIYRHASSEAQAPAPAGIKFKEILHRADSVKEIILCDLPDFDSLVKEHSDQVASFIVQLDMVIWVVSPEKYADARFHDLLARTLKSRENFLFVLNKTDIIFDGVSQDDGERRLKALAEVFSGHLTTAGIERPVIFTISARDESGNKAWNRLGALKGDVFKRRDEKQILAIKAANLEQELSAIISALDDRSLAVSAITDALDAFGSEVSKESADWIMAAEAPIEELARIFFEKRKLASETNELPLAGWPGKLFLMIGARKGASSIADHLLPKDIAASLKPLGGHLSYIEDRLINRLKTVKGVPGAFFETIHQNMDSEGLASEVEARLTSAVREALSSRTTSRRMIFVGFQKLIYLASFVFFLMALASGGSWEAFFQNPAPGSFFIALFSTLKNLFTASGLAALCVYVLICLFLGLRFYLKARRYLEAAAKTEAVVLKKGLFAIWEEAFSETGSRVMALKQRLASEADAASSIATENGSL